LSPQWLTENIKKDKKFDVRVSNLKGYEFWFRAEVKPVKTNDFQAFQIVHMGMKGLKTNKQI